MNQDQHLSALLSRAADYQTIMRTTMLVFLGVAAMIHFGPDGYSAPLVTLAIAASAYGILAGGVALDDLIALREDLSDEVANSTYGQLVKTRNLPMLKMISSGLVGLIGLAELFAILV